MPPTHPSQDKPIPDSQVDQTALPVVSVPSHGDIDLGSLQSRVDEVSPLASLPNPLAVPIPDSQSGQSALPVVNVPSHGDIDLGSLQSRVDEDIPLASLPNPLAPPMPGSQAGQTMLPVVNVPSHGDIDLGSLQSRVDEEVPMASLPNPLAPPLPGSQAGLSVLPTISVPSEGDIDLGSLQSKADEEIPVASLPEPPSGQSLTSWTEVIRRQRATAQAGQASAGDFRVDAPSDKDILIRFDEAVGPPRRTGDTSEILPGELPVFTAPSGRSESDIDLGVAGLRGPGLSGTGESEVKFDILFPPSDAAGAMPAPVQPPLSSVDFRSATRVPPPSNSDIPFAAAVDPSAASGLNLGTDSGPPGEGGRSSILDALLQNPGVPTRGGSSGSVLDFGSIPVGTHKPTAAAGGPVVPTPPGIDLTASAPELSGRHIVDSTAELASEDAIDLYAEPAPSPSITDSGTLEISEEAVEESQRRAESQESSSVDLSSRPSYYGAEFDSALEAPSGTAVPSNPDIDLDLPAAAEGDENSSMIHRGGRDANPDALAAEFRARRQSKGDRPEPSKKPARAPRREVMPARTETAPGRGRGFLIGASALGLLLGAGGVLAAYFAGALPDRRAPAQGTGADPSADVVRLRQDADTARKEATAARADVDRQVAEARKASDNEINQLGTARTAAEGQMKRAMADAKKAETDRDAAVKAAADARTAEQAARTNLTTVTKAAEDARKQLADAVAGKRTADDALVGLTRALKTAGVDPARPEEGIKELVARRLAAQAQAKEANDKLAESTKKVTELTGLAETAKKSFDDARKAAEEAAKARDASDATVKAVADRLARAKFVADRADAAAILKGIDDAVKAGSTDATATLRDELKQAREQEAKAKADLAATREKEADATKVALAAKAEAQKLAADAARSKADNDKLTRDATEAGAKATAAEKAAAVAKAEAERSATEVTRLKVETERLARDLETVKELAELIKTPAAQVAGPLTKPDPERLADQFFGDGMRAFHRGQTVEAESAFRKSIQFRPNDARYHYLLGLTLWARKETAAAEAEFEKGRDLELAGRPTSRSISAALERIQGAARQTVDAYRP